MKSPRGSKRCRNASKNLTGLRSATPADRPLLVTSAEVLAALVGRLRTSSLLAFDTEAASFHRYTDRVYLIQVTSPSETAIIDPLAIQDLSLVGGLLADPDIEVVFHDADYDLRSLDRDYGVRVRRVFDTRIAAQLLGEPEIGLGALLEKYFAVRLDKKLQRADWSQRPLTPEMIAYAAADTRHLPALKQTLEQRLRGAGRLEWAREEFAQLESVRWTPGDSGEAYARLKGAKALQPRSVAVLRALHAWRDGEARTLDRATFRICANEILLALAKSTPTTRAELEALREVPASIARRYADQMLTEIRSALALPADQWPRIERHRGKTRFDPAVEARFERLKAMRNARAQELGLEPGVLCPNGTLEAIARLDPSAAGDFAAVSELRAWQRQALEADRIRAALQTPA